MLTNVQSLKIQLMEEGIHIPEGVREAVSGPVTLADYASTSGITMMLGEDVWVNAPIVDFNSNFVKDPPHRLVHQGNFFFVESGGKRHEAKLLPVPSYHDKHTTSTGELYIWHAITHADRVRISPIGGCAMACQFCDIPYVAKYRKKSVEALVESIRTALNDPGLP